MKTEKNPAAIDELYEGFPKLEANVHDDEDEGTEGFLKPELLENICAEAQHRWESGGKEIYEKFQADPEFMFTNEYKNYFLKWGISNDLPF